MADFKEIVEDTEVLMLADGRIGAITTATAIADVLSFTVVAQKMRQTIGNSFIAYPRRASAAAQFDFTQYGKITKRRSRNQIVLLLVLVLEFCG
jgi:hypothetical protein